MPSWDFVRDNVLPIVLYLAAPALASSAIVLQLALWTGGEKQAAAGSALAICLGVVGALATYAAAPLLQTGWANLNSAAMWQAIENAVALDSSSWGRLAWVIVAALLIGRIVYLADVHSCDGWLLRSGAALAFAWLLIPPEERERIPWLAPALAATMAVLWSALDRLAAEPGSSSVALGIFLALLTAAQLMLHAHSAKLMDTLAALAFAFAGLALVAFRRGVQFGGAIPAVAVALPTLLLMGQRTTYSQLPWGIFALPALAPLLLILTLPMSRLPKPILHLARLTLVLVPLLAAMLLAWRAEPISFSNEWE